MSIEGHLEGKIFFSFLRNGEVKWRRLNVYLEVHSIFDLVDHSVLNYNVHVLHSTKVRFAGLILKERKMKKLIVIIFAVVVLLSVAGCGPMTAEDRMAWQSALQGYSRQQQNLAYQQNQQLRENGRYINQQLQKNPNSYYWQERRARQEYYQNWGK